MNDEFGISLSTIFGVFDKKDINVDSNEKQILWLYHKQIEPYYSRNLVIDYINWHIVYDSITNPGYCGGPERYGIFPLEEESKDSRIGAGIRIDMFLEY